MASPNSDVLQAIAAERPYLLRVAAKRLRNAELSEDAVQATLAAAVANASRFRRRSSVRTWLTSILLNRVVDAQRARHREPLLDDLPRTAVPGAPAEMAPDPAEIVQAWQVAGALGERLEALPKAVASAFVMRELRGRPSKEIRRRLNLTPSQYWQALHRARSAMRGAIETQEAFPWAPSHGALEDDRRPRAQARGHPMGSQPALCRRWQRHHYLGCIGIHPDLGGAR